MVEQEVIDCVNDLVNKVVRQDGLYSNYADEVRDWAKKEIAKLQHEIVWEKSRVNWLENVTVVGSDMCCPVEQNRQLKEENKKLQEKINMAEAGLEEESTLSCNLLEQIEELQEQITCLESDSANEVSQAEFDDIVEEKDDEIKRLKEEHNKFDEIWKTEGITEQDIIDMKRQISNQSDLIKELQSQLKESAQEHK